MAGLDSASRLLDYLPCFLPHPWAHLGELLSGWLYHFTTAGELGTATPEYSYTFAHLNIPSLTGALKDELWKGIFVSLVTTFQKILTSFSFS